MRNALIIVIAIFVILLSPVVNAANTYPPENAAVLYYKILANYPPDDKIMDKISDYSRGEIELDEEITKHLNAFQYIIKELTVASDIPHCNWGIDFSEGITTHLPGLGAFKRYTYLLLSDARSLASNEDYYEAIERCITAEKMASHVGENTLINALVGTAISAMSDKCMAHIISETPADKEILIHLRSQLEHFDNRIGRMKKGFFAEKQLAEVLYDKTSPHRITTKLLTDDVSYLPEEIKKSPITKEILKKVEACDPQFFDTALKYHIAIIYDAATAFDLPYQQAQEKLSKQIPEKYENDAKEKPEAFLAAIYMPALSKCYTLGVRSQNSLNALKTALDIYLVQAKTGKLPDKLPVSAINDLYTDKAMVYEITDEGFTLRCQGTETEKDKKKDTYEFKIK